MLGEVSCYLSRVTGLCPIVRCRVSGFGKALRADRCITGFPLIGLRCVVDVCLFFGVVEVGTVSALVSLEESRLVGVGCCALDKGSR